MSYVIFRPERQSDITTKTIDALSDCSLNNSRLNIFWSCRSPYFDPLAKHETKHLVWRSQRLSELTPVIFNMELTQRPPYKLHTNHTRKNMITYLSWLKVKLYLCRNTII